MKQTMKQTMRRGMLRGAPALVLAAGCFSVPPYEPQTGLTYTESAGDGAVVAGRGTGVGFSSGGASAGSGFSLRFADGPGFHFPDALMIDGADAMGHEQPSVGCFREDETGVLIAPTSRISAHGGAQVGKNVLSAAALRGPAVVQVKLEWSTAFPMTCSTTHSPGGTSTFTVFPDGKIVRSDTIADAATALINWSTCACETPTISNDMGFRFFTYWTLARSFIKTLYTPDPQSLPPAGVYNGIGNVDVSCVDSGSSQVTVAWPVTMDTWIRGGIDVLGFAHEQGGGPSDLTTYDVKDRSAVFISHDGCKPAIARAEQFLESLDPQSTMVSPVRIGDAQLRPSAIDGIYGGDSGNGEPGIELAGDSVEIAGQTPPGIAVWLRFPHPVDAVRATRSDSAVVGEWYVAQQVDKRSWIVWFRDQVPVNQKITISPR